MRILKRIFVPLLLVTMLCSIAYAVLLAESVYEKYKETLEWKNSSLQYKIHMVPPGLAQNYVTGEEQRLLGIVTEMNEALEEMKANEGIVEDKYEKYMILRDSVQKEIEANEENREFLESNGFNDLNFYLKADSTIKIAYSVLNVEDLEKLESTFASRILEEEQNIDKAFLKRIQTIANDLKNLENFSEKALDKLGVIDKKVLKVKSNVNTSITEELIKEIKEKDLRKFPHIENLYGVLTSEYWSNILAHNEDSKEYFTWKESKKILESLSKSNYVPVSGLVTVEDIQRHFNNVKLEEKEHHTINKESKIEAVYYDGQLLSNSLYVKKGSNLEFVINYEYIEDPKSTITVKYLDNLGNQLDVKIFEDYVGNPISINTKLEDYVLVGSPSLLYKFPEEDVTIQLVYEEFVPPAIDEEFTNDVDDNEIDVDDSEENSEEIE